MGARRLKTGIPGLDGLIQGGILERSVTIIVGAAGTGKTTLGIQFLYNGVKDYNERGLLVSFGEPSDQFRTISVGSLGMSELDKFISDGTLTIESVVPETRSTEAILSRFEELLEKTRAKRVLVDDISALQSVSNEDDFHSTLKRLAQIAKAKDATLIFTLTSSELSGASITGVGISTVMDNIIMLRYVELDGRMERSFILLKMRGTNHDNMIRKFTIGPGGLKIINAFEGYSGILSGNVIRARERFERMEKEIEAEERKAKITRRLELEKELEEKEKRIEAEQKASRERRRAEFTAEEQGVNSE